jgi:hypothetical protein
MKAFMLFVLVFFTSGLSIAPPDAVVVFSFGVGARNVLDSENGTFTKDMVGDPPVTVPLRLTPGELRQIGEKARATGFFSQPAVIKRSDCGFMMFPESSFRLRIRNGASDHTVSWTTACEPESLQQLRKLLETMIRSKEEYKKLPKPKSGYL